MTVSEFEKLVLEAIYTGKLDVEDIASSTSLPRTVVEVCVRKLMEKGLIDESLNITEEALQLIGAAQHPWEKDSLRMMIDVLILSVGIILLLYLFGVVL